MTSKRRIPATEARLLDEPDEPYGDDVVNGAVVAGQEVAGFADDVEVLEADVVGAQFTVDVVVARLLSEGVDVVRSSPFEVNVTFGGIARLGEHKLIFRATDRDAVGEALRDAGLL